MIGATGEYHLGLSGNYEIAFLRFDENSLKMNYGLNGEVASYVVIDIVYDTNEGWVNEQLFWKYSKCRTYSVTFW